MMRKLIPLLCLGLFCLGQRAQAQFDSVKDSVVQLYGIVMTSDSLQGIPAVSITIKNSNRGTVTNDQGVFSIVVLKGDQIEFSHVSYKHQTITIPRDIKGNQYSVIQLLVEDTAYLPATIIKPRPTPEQFARDFASTKVPMDDIEIARQNNSKAKLRALASVTPGDAQSAVSLQMRQIATKASYAGQIPPNNLLNPAAWAEFIQAWKRGDFKRKDY